ncbi:MAG: hypothetical protein ACUVUU_03670 [bacterium]
MKALILGVVLSLVLASVCLGGIPSAGTSTVEAQGQGTPACNPDKAVVCPQGDAGSVLVTVTVRNAYGDPLPDKVVDCYAQTVSGTFCFCAGVESQTDTTDEYGRAYFVFDRFGGLGTIRFGAECQGVVFNPSENIVIVSFDSDGTCGVDLTDFSRFAGAYGGSNSSYDYDCNGTVALPDFIVFANHYIHACP